MSPETFEFQVGDVVKHTHIDSNFYGKEGTVTAVQGETVDVEHEKGRSVWTLARHVSLVRRP